MPTGTSANLLALIGIFDIVGTIASGWLTDRVDSRYLLFGYYFLRGLSLLVVPALLGPHVQPSLFVFILFYGLDWVATVPPTVALCRQHFGVERAGVVFGWVFASHMVGAGVAASFAGWIRQAQRRLLRGLADRRRAVPRGRGLCLLIPRRARRGRARPAGEPVTDSMVSRRAQLGLAGQPGGVPLAAGGDHRGQERLGRGARRRRRGDVLRDLGGEPAADRRPATPGRSGGAGRGTGARPARGRSAATAMSAAAAQAASAGGIAAGGASRSRTRSRTT